MPNQVNWANNSSSDVGWVMEWGNGNGQDSGNLAAGHTQTENYKNPMNMVGFNLSAFTGQAVAGINKGLNGYASQMTAQDDTPSRGTAPPSGRELLWTNFSKTQTVLWLVVTTNGSSAGTLGPGDQKTLASEDNVTQVGFVLTDFTGQMASNFGSTTLVAELSVSDP